MKIGIAGYPVRDYCPANKHAAMLLKECERFLDGEIKIGSKNRVRDNSDFLAYLASLPAREIALEIKSGGGVKHNIKALEMLGVKAIPFYACEEHGVALVINSDNTTTNITTTRGDRKTSMQKKRKEGLMSFLIMGNPLLVNSVSNEELAETIAEHSLDGKLYTLVTSSLKDNAILGKLVRSSRALFFSVREFYEFAGQRQRWEELGLDKEISQREAERAVSLVVDDARKFSDNGTTMLITLGQYGAIAYEPATKRAFWTFLNERKREEVKQHLSSNGYSTNGCGDHFAPAVIFYGQDYFSGKRPLEAGESIEAVVKRASNFVVNNVIRYSAELKDFESQEVLEDDEAFCHEDARQEGD